MCESVQQKLGHTTNAGNKSFLASHDWSLIHEPLYQVSTAFWRFLKLCCFTAATRFLDDKCQSNGFFLGNIMASTYWGNCTFELCRSFHSKYQAIFAKKGKYSNFLIKRKYFSHFSGL